MKTLNHLDSNILRDYTAWQGLNKANWSIASYLNEFYDLNAALAFSKLYFPEFCQHRNCVILSFRFDEIVFDQWYSHFDGNIQMVEKYCNLYELKDFFHINSSYFSEDQLEEALSVFGNVLKSAWELNCQKLFPNREMICEIFDQHGEKKITLYTLRQS